MMNTKQLRVKGVPVHRVLLLIALVAALFFAHPAVAAIPEPPPYPWEYCPDGAVAFIPLAAHSGPVLTVDELPPGW